ncbi:MAG: DNA replication and repair protein RecF [Armatimonadota bacterium]|nr:DNA replication and repair protein RecF [Armatimonadota bacterium]
MAVTCNVRRLALRDFRNHARTDLELQDGLTIFVGGNGQGKSNLLEALYVVATGRSYRTTRDAEMIAHGAHLARVHAVVIRRGGREEEQEALISRHGETGSVRLRVSGVETPRSRVLGRVPVVVAAPWDLDVVRGAAVLRRRLLDAALAQTSPAYFFALHRYYRVLAQRNAVLRQRSGAHFEPWEAQMVTLGARITARRRTYVERLNARAAEWFRHLGGVGRLEVRYRPSWTGASEEEVAVVAREELRRRRADEIRRGSTLSGPQRDEVEFVLDGVPLRSTGSLGQWRLAMLAVRCAEREVVEAELGTRPLLLLDDVLAELDDARQQRVLQLTGTGQVLVTMTVLPSEPRGVELVRAGMRVLNVSGGTVGEGVWSHRSATS